MRVLLCLWEYYCAYESIIVLMRVLLCLWEYYCAHESIIVLMRVLLCLWEYYCAYESIIVLMRVLLCSWEYYCAYESIIVLMRVLLCLWEYYCACSRVKHDTTAELIILKIKIQFWLKVEKISHNNTSHCKGISKIVLEECRLLEYKKAVRTSRETITSPLQSPAS
jgi:hypothetical protein